MPTMSTTLVGLSIAIKELIQSHASSLGIRRVDYGDVDRVHESIQVCVEPENKMTSSRTTGRGVTREFRVHTFIYFSYITNPEYNREFCDRMAESLETILNQDPTMGQRLISGMVTEVASGAATKDGVTVRANRITYSGTTVDQLPMTGW